MRRLFWLVCLVLIAAARPARAQERLNVVASFSILGDFVRNVGGDRVSVTTLVGPDGDAHVYTPTPADAKKIADAKLVIVNGLGFEGWLSRLVQSSGSKADHRDRDQRHRAAQARLRCRSACLAIGRQCEDLCRPTSATRWPPPIPPAPRPIAPMRRPIWQSSMRSTARCAQAVAQIPQDRRKVISTHDAFGYLAAAYGIEFMAPLGVSTESEASARDIARIITQIRTQKIPAVFLENISDPRLIRRISAETGARVGGTLYSDSLTDEKGDAPTYIDMVRHNIKALTSALAN